MSFTNSKLSIYGQNIQNTSRKISLSSWKIFKKKLLIDLCLFKTDTQQRGIMGDYAGKGKWGTICMLMEERAKSLFFYKKKQTRSESSLTNIFIRECSKILWYKNEQHTSPIVIVHAQLHLFDYDRLHVCILRNTYWTQISDFGIQL